MTDALASVSTAVITVSDRRAAGSADDTAGPAVIAALHEAGAHVEAWIVPDGRQSVTTALTEAVATGARLVLTVGGTGAHPRDETPEATAPLLARTLPGIPELLRTSANPLVATAALSRGVAGITTAPKPAVIINLPGSEAGARDAIATLMPLLPHLLSQVAGGDH